MSLRTCKRTALLLAVAGLSARDAGAAGPRDYEGPTGLNKEGEVLQPGAPPATEPPPADAPTEAPPADAPPADAPAEAPAAAPKEAEEEEPAGCGDDGFCVEDLTEDEEALKKELAPKQKVKVEGATGKITGKVIDAASGSPLIGVQVSAVGTAYKTKTDLNGEYELVVPPGSYQIKIWYDTHEGMTVSGVAVAKDAAVDLSRTLRPIAGMHQTLVVKAEVNKESAAGKLVERKKSVSARDMLSRDDIRKSGGGSTGSVARRIVGSTIVGGRFLFVRGLGHRYGNTLFDGARMPSPDPNLRTVPLDIFPSSALGAINVQKTFVPDVPGDFTGASVQLESREIPDKLTWTLGANLGINTATTGRERASGDHFLGDRFGFGNLSRGLPGSFDTADPIDISVQKPGSLEPVWSPGQIEKFGESMPSTRTVVASDRRALPNMGLSASVGNSWRPGGTKLGVLAALTYNNVRQTLREDIRLFRGECKVEAPTGQDCPEGQFGVDTENPRVDYKGLKTTDTVQWSGIGLLKWELNKHNRLSAVGFYTRDADNESRVLDGYARGTLNEDIGRNTRLRYMMRSIAFTRLGGRHVFPRGRDFQIDWFGSYAQARLDDPLLREMLFRQNSADGSYVVDRAESGKFQFFRLRDDTGSGGLDFTVPFKQWSGIDAKFKFGGWVEGKRRNFDVRYFDYEVAGGLTPPAGTGNIINRDTIGGGLDAAQGGTQPFFLTEFTRPKDSYNAGQRVLAGYGLLDLPLARWVRVVGGARFEASDIRVEPYDRFGRAIAAEDRAFVRDRNVLPSGSLIFSPRQDMNIRLIAAQTVARPEFRELAPFLFTDFAGGFDVTGNPRLRTTRITNADLRWEWFPSANEVIAVSAFYKYFDDPIERVIGSRATPLQSYRNAEAANNIGGEVELRKNLEFISKRIKDLSVGVNFAYIYSRVVIGPPLPDDPLPLDPTATRARPMEGQSPYVLNAYLAYDNERSGTNVRLLFNSFGKRIAFVGSQRLPNIYELPVHTLDFALLQRLHKGLSLSFSALNILNWQTRFRQQDSLTYAVRRGVSFVLGLQYSF